MGMLLRLHNIESQETVAQEVAEKPVEVAEKPSKAKATTKPQAKANKK